MDIHDKGPDSPTDDSKASKPIHLVHDFETAFLNRFWGLWWTSFTAAAGVAAAAARSLPGEDEAIVQRFWKTLPKDRHRKAMIRRVAKSSLASALAASANAQPVLEAARRAAVPSPALARKLDEMLTRAEHLGRMAAKSNRMHFLVKSEPGANR